MVILDENDFNEFWKIIEGNQNLLSRINQKSRLDGITEKAYIKKKLRESKSNYVREIYYSWASQGRPPLHAMSVSRARVTPVIYLPSQSKGRGITKRKKRRKPRKKKSVKKRKGKSKKKRVRRGRKTRRKVRGGRRLQLI